MVPLVGYGTSPLHSILSSARLSIPVPAAFDLSDTERGGEQGLARKRKREREDEQEESCFARFTSRWDPFRERHKQGFLAQLFFCVSNLRQDLLHSCGLPVAGPLS